MLGIEETQANKEHSAETLSIMFWTNSLSKEI